MVFASLTFLFLFLPASLLVYYVTPAKGRNVSLLLINVIFYGWGEPDFLLVILFATIMNYIFGQLIARNEGAPRARKLLVTSAVAIDLSLLAVFKYANFFVSSLKIIPAFSVLPDVHILLPLGISFYTFHVISYVVDVYRGDTPAQKSLVRFGVYMSLFPQMIAGPIVRYKQMQGQLGERRVAPAQFASGIRLILLGLAKKVLIANQMGALWASVQAAGGHAGFLGAWGGAAAFTFQIYFDFGGYSDMARGIGRLFGFELPVNFNYPYIARSVTDFWRRWHMSLSLWFRDYVYIPLGGSRRGQLITVRNLFIVWVLTGFWHGANWNFLLWGFYYFALLTFEKLFFKPVLEKLPAALSHLYAILSFMLGWVIFANESFGAMGSQLRQMLGLGGFFAGGGLSYQLLAYLPLGLIALLCSTPAVKKAYGRLRHPVAAGAVDCAACAVILVLCTASLISQSYNPFLYFRF